MTSSTPGLSDSIEGTWLARLLSKAADSLVSEFERDALLVVIGSGKDGIYCMNAEMHPTCDTFKQISCACRRFTAGAYSSLCSVPNHDSHAHVARSSGNVDLNDIGRRVDGLQAK